MAVKKLLDLITATDPRKVGEKAINWKSYFVTV
jgi:hypothetical protein